MGLGDLTQHVHASQTGADKSSLMGQRLAHVMGEESLLSLLVDLYFYFIIILIIRNLQSLFYEF